MKRPLSLLVLSLSLSCSDADPEDKGTADGDTGDATTADELCNGQDDDGDGEVDEGLTRHTWYVDADGDGRGDDDATMEDCGQPDGTASRGGDCDDTNPAISPDAPELCNGVDDDCDGTIDGPTSDDAVTRYPDEDGDGYGLAAERTCEADTPGWIEDSLGLDCDDSDAAVHPGAVERCNGIDDDCDPATSEDGSARLTDLDGTVYHWPADRFDGQLAILRPGTLSLCAGDFPWTLRPRVDLDIRAAPEATSRPHIDASGLDGPALMVRDDGISVQVSGIDLTGGLGTAAIAGELTGGGAVECDTDGTLAFEDVAISGGTADLGGGLLARGGCQLTLTDCQVEGAQAAWAGGCLAVIDGSATVVGSSLKACGAPVGAGAAVVGWEGEAGLDLTESLLSEHTADRLGGGVYVEAAGLTCIGDGSTAQGITTNSAPEGGGIWMAADSTAELTDCDLGLGATDNLFDDVAGDLDGAWAVYEDGLTTLSCTSEGCE